MDAVPETGWAGRTVEAGRGLEWWKEAWALFQRNPLMWIVFAIVSGLLLIVLSKFPLVGMAVAAVCGALFKGGWMLSARKADRGEPLEIADLFSGFAQALPALALLGLAYFAIEALALAIVGFFGLASFGSLLIGSAHESTAQMIAAIVPVMVGAFIAVLIEATFESLVWFAVPMVVLDGAQPIDALRLSATAVLRNVMPFLVFGLIGIALGLVLVPLTLGLALLVLWPLGMLAVYVSYRDIFSQAR